MFSVTDIKSEKGESSVSVIFHSCGFGKFSCVDAKSGNAGKFKIREVARFVFGDCAGIAKAASAGTDHKTFVAFLTSFFIRRSPEALCAPFAFLIASPSL